MAVVVLASILSFFSMRTSSIKQQLQRLLSFESADSLEEAPTGDAPRASSPADERHQRPPPPTDHAVIEVRTSTLRVQSSSLPRDAPEDDAEEREQHSKRIAKSVQTVALFLATASFGLMVTQPAQVVVPSRLLFHTYTTFVYLTLCMGIGLSIHSIVAHKRPARAAAWVQKRLMVIGLVFMAAAFVLRTCIVLPVSSLSYVWLLFLLVGLMVFLSLLMAWKYELGDSGSAEHPGGAVYP